MYVKFQVESRKLAIDARFVVELVPFVDLRIRKGTRSPMAGEFVYRGTPLPVIDLTRVLSKRRSRDVLGTRIIVCEVGSKRFGVLVERALDGSATLEGVEEYDVKQLLAHLGGPGCT